MRISQFLVQGRDTGRRGRPRQNLETGLVIAQRWAERKRRPLIIAPANLRKQWHQELQDKVSLQALILESSNHRQLKKDGNKFPFEQGHRVLICSYQFTKADELEESLAHAPTVLLTATPLQNSLLELYGLVSLVDERVFGDPCLRFSGN